MIERRDPDSGIRVIGPSLPYADGAEDELLAILRGASDTSSRSDELVTHIHDWPTRYHLSRLRGNIVRPLRLGLGMRVLEVGCGTGAITRVLGESGATVLAVEGTLARARAAAARCRDLPNVEVVAGPLDAAATELPEAAEPFDVVVVIGVLEYSTAAIGGAGGPEAFLASVARHLGERGVLALAIENQIGLKYLLGYNEDHHGRPMVGVEDYPDGPGIRTWSRRELADLLDGAGLTSRRWLSPFPDYKLPTVVVAESLMTEAPDLADRVVGHPIRDWTAPPAFASRERDVHRVMLRAGLGADVANSFLVVASMDPAGPGRLTGATEVWDFGEETLSAFTIEREGARGDGGGALRLAAEGADRRHGGLIRRATVERAAGVTVEDRVLAALDEGTDPGPTLRAWVAAVRAANHTDVGPSRCLIHGDPAAPSVGIPPAEWLLEDAAAVGITGEVPLVGGLMELVSGARARGTAGAERMGRDLLVALGAAAGLPPAAVDVSGVAAWLDAEARLRTLRLGGRPEDHRRDLEALLGDPPPAPPRAERIGALVATPAPVGPPVDAPVSTRPGAVALMRRSARRMRRLGRSLVRRR